MALKGFFRKSGDFTECDKCKLYTKSTKSKLKLSGEGKLGCLMVVEAPSSGDSDDGEYLSGDGGGALKFRLKKIGLDLHRDFWITGSLNCPSSKIQKTHIKCCRPNLKSQIARLKPRLIWLMGDVACESFFGERHSKNTITKWRNTVVPDPDTGTYVLPMYSPWELIKKQKDINYQKTFDRDLKFAVQHLKNFDLPKPEPCNLNIKTSTDFAEIIEFFDYLQNRKPLTAFDYETSGIKPFNLGHKIHTMSIADEQESFAFPVDYSQPGTDTHDYWSHNQWTELRERLVWYLGDKEMKKIAHNARYELTWSRNIFDVQPSSVVWCTMDSAHILDERENITSLKFQAHIHFGMHEYEKDFKKYCESKNGNDFNSVWKFPLQKLLTYNAIDSSLTMKLYKQQQKQFSLPQNRPLNTQRILFMKGSHALHEAQFNGIRIDMNNLLMLKEELTKEIETAEKELMDSPEALKFKAKFNRPINPKSSKDLRDLFFVILGKKSKKDTDSGLESVDKEVLADLDSDFAKNLLEIRKHVKTRDTYISQIESETNDDHFLRPAFNLNTTVTGRSSSNSPNFQNLPVRDDDAKLLRKAFVPRKGFKILEVDYGALEVRIIACYSKDKVLVDYILSGHDPHGDQAIDLFCLDEVRDLNAFKKTPQFKVLRFYAKNGWVFPMFYGSYFKNCAKNLWANCAHLPINGLVSVQKHLSKLGIKNEDHYTDFCKEQEKLFWDKYTGVKSWQEETIDFYRKKGYVESFFGFRRRGHLSTNQIINAPIQGTAFHLLLWSVDKLKEYYLNNDCQSKLIGQIHDCVLTDLHPEEQKDIIKVHKRIMTVDIEQGRPWLIVPLTIETELTKVDQSWYHKKEIRFK